ncbi:hypothetical protein PCASD_25771 [Puccinia coronata f. sp. avenae]|uniref:Uncharacterized protein n=1 Tax=Puccinia coronata f. sp. avenae TaxID=200324 RepID=A0A2N5TMU2_9BASI|nr:hypothetical protein PCASD_25771 [Puccinia coronata f. sp. avenae]
MDCKSLDEKMELASDAAAQLDVLAQLPPDPAVSNIYHPLSSQHYNSHPSPVARPPRDPDAMEINAARVLPNSPIRSLLNALRFLCRARQLCFCCLAPIVPGSHTGSLNCPNAPILPEKREAFVARCCQHQPASAQISAISNAPENPVPNTLTYLHPPTQDEGDSLPNSAPLDLSPLEGYNEQYKEYNESACATVAVPIATVHVHLDCSTKNWLLVPVSFRAPDSSMVPATILVDTGDMANFINKVGGVVTEDWVGPVQFSTIDSKPFSLQRLFGVTRLGLVDAIFGLPWLDKQGWIASGSLNGGHQFTLGSTPLYVIESTLGGGTPGGKLFTPSS